MAEEEKLKGNWKIIPDCDKVYILFVDLITLKRK